MMVSSTDAILIAGGYGVVGRQIAECLRRRYPSLPVIIAGRNPARGASLASQLTNADTVALDVDQSAPLRGMKPRAILAAVNDPHDFLLMDAIHNGVPYVDITRWTERLKTAVSGASAEVLQAPVLLSSAWMAGMVAVVAVGMARQLRSVDRIDISVLYSLNDKAGPNSAEYMDRLATPFPATIDGQLRQVYPYTDPRRVTFPTGLAARVYRFDTPDQFTLPMTTGAKTVAARIAFDSALATRLLTVLTRSGLWKLISGKRFTPLRRSLLYNPGQGASHQIVVDVAGQDENGTAKTIQAEIVDPQGQTHLTAVGALIQVGRLLGLDGAAPPAPGIIYPDTAPQIDSALQTLRHFGVTITMG